MSKKDFTAFINLESAKPDAIPILKKHKQLYLKGFDIESPKIYDNVVEYIKKNCQTANTLETVRDSICGGVKISLNQSGTD